MSRDDCRLVVAGGICGICGILLYMGAAGWEALSPAPATTAEFLRNAGQRPHGMWLHFTGAAAALLWLVGFLGLGKLLESGCRPVLARVATVFGVVACGILVIMLIVQGGVMVRMGQTFAAAQSDAQREIVISVYRGLRVVDQGIDLAFDTFFFTAWISMAIAMYRRPRFGRILPLLVVLLFALDTPLQLWYAPAPPPVDTGPVGSLLLIIVFVQAIRAGRDLMKANMAQNAHFSTASARM